LHSVSAPNAAFARKALMLQQRVGRLEDASPLSFSSGYA